MNRRWLILSVALLVVAVLVAAWWPLTNTKAASIAKAALLRDGVAVDGREPTEIIDSNGIRLVSFGVIDGFEYVVQVPDRWSPGEVSRMSADGG